MSLRRLVRCALLVSLTSVALAATTWQHGESSRYEVYTDASTAVVERLVADLERVRVAMNQKLHFDPDAPGRLRVIVFTHHEDYLAVRPVNAGALTSRDTYGHTLPFYFRPGLAVALRKESAAASQQVLLHELVHVLHVSRLARSPLWYGEGLGEYFSTAEVSREGVIFGKQASTHLRLLRKGLPIPFADLFGLNFASPRYALAVERGLYSEAWSFVHYCLRDGDGGDAERLMEFVSREVAGAAGKEETFREVFGVTFSEMEKRLARHVSGGAFKTTFVPASSAAAEGLGWQPLAATQRADLMAELEVCARLPADGEARLQQIREPLSRQLTLAQLAYRRGDRAAIRDALLAAAANPTVDARVAAFAARFVLDVALRDARPDTRLPAETVMRVRDLAWQALRKEPRNCVAAEALARVEAAAPEPEAANIVLATGVIPTMPDQGPTMLALAILAFRRGDWEAASAGCERLLSAPATGSTVRRQAEALRAMLVEQGKR